MDMLDGFTRNLASLGLAPGRALVAVSGGVDSTALLSLLWRSRAQHGLELLVGHADHGIHPDSAAVARLVERRAAEFALPFYKEELRLGPDAGETVARERRYAWLHQMCAATGARYLITAHHADDQVETVLLRLLHGSGPAGLAAMAAISGALVRPLLPYRREDLARYVREQGLVTWDDPANRDPRHLRSWVRTSLLPEIRGRIEDVDTRLARSAAQAALDRRAWDQVLDRLPGIEWRDEIDGGSVAVAGTAGYDSPLLLAILMAAARRAGCRLGPARAGRAAGFLRQGGSGARFELGGGCILELAFGRAHFLRPATRAWAPWALDGALGEQMLGPWRFRWSVDAAPARQERMALRAWFSPGGLTVRPWQPGDRVRPVGGTGRRLVVRCFQDARVPRHRRLQWPVLAAPDGVVWVPGVCRSDHRLPPGGAEALRVDVTLG